MKSFNLYLLKIIEFIIVTIICMYIQYQEIKKFLSSLNGAKALVNKELSSVQNSVEWLILALTEGGYFLV